MRHRVPEVAGRYDTIICGGGSAGCVLAARLTEDPARSVLLIEAGPDYQRPKSLPEELQYGRILGRDIMHSRFNWQSIGVAVPGRTVLVARGKVTGGSSAISGPTMLRGAPEDFNAWATLGNPVWAYARVLEAFRRLESDVDFGGPFHGATGPVPIARFNPDTWLPSQEAFHQACLRAGHSPTVDMNHPQSTGVGPTPMSTLGDRRWSTAGAYLGQARRRANLTVVPDTIVTRVLIRDACARAVVLRGPAAVAARVVKGDEIVVSCGAIGSPQLLMLSGVGARDAVRRVAGTSVRDLPAVGQHLIEHPSVSVLYRVRDGASVDGSAPIRQLTLQYSSTPHGSRNDMKINLQSFGVNPSNGVAECMSLRASVNLPEATGSVAPVSSQVNNQPRINLGLLGSRRDLERMREAVRLCVELGESPQFSELFTELLDPPLHVVRDDTSLDDWLMARVVNSHHLAGTCRMGPQDDPLAVVDQFGRVHGIGGLRVADASIMPTPVRANTNLTTIMIAEHLASHWTHQ